MTPEQKIAEIKKFGAKAIGRSELIALLSGKRLSSKKRIVAFCYDCCGYYADGKEDCANTLCPLHVDMPYRAGRPTPKIRVRTKPSVPNPSPARGSEPLLPLNHTNTHRASVPSSIDAGET